MIVATARRDLTADHRIEYADTNGIVLLQCQHSKRRSHRLGIIKLRHRSRFELHRFAAVDNQHDANVRVFFELLQIVTIGSRPKLPVNTAQVIPGHVFTVL